MDMRFLEDSFHALLLWACGRGDMSTPSLGGHLNPISARGGGEIMPPLQFSDLPTAMHYVAGALHEISPLFPVCNMFLVHN